MWSCVLELVIQQTNSTVTTTVLQSAGGLSSIDYSQTIILLASLVLGGSGIAGWIMTYIQLRHETKERALQQFRELVLTKDFLEFLGMLRRHAELMAKGESLARSREQILNDKSLTPEEKTRRIKELENRMGGSLAQLTDQARQAATDFTETVNKIRKTGALFLLSDKIENEIEKCVSSFVHANEPDEFLAIVDQVETIFADLKKILGLAVFE